VAYKKFCVFFGVEVGLLPGIWTFWGISGFLPRVFLSDVQDARSVRELTALEIFHEEDMARCRLCIL